MLDQRFASLQRAAHNAATASVAGTALGVFQAVATILAVRVLLLAVMAGGFFLAMEAMRQQTAISVCVVVAYAILFIFPVVFLEHRKSGGNHADSNS